MMPHRVNTKKIPKGHCNKKQTIFVQIIVFINKTILLKTNYI